MKAVAALGGTAQAAEIRDQVIDDLDVADELVAITYEGRDKSVFLDRLDWARSYAKLSGFLDSPKRGLFVLSALGKELLDLPDDAAHQRVHELDRQVRDARRTQRRDRTPADDESLPDEQDTTESDWQEALLQRLHRLSPDAFEEFVIYVLKAYGLRLSRVGGSGDEGIDGIGLAPISDVLSSRVAVQAKRRDPGTAIGRDPVALFQRDASAVGAERAIFVTLGRYTEAARKAATAATPTVDLIDGARLCELALKQRIGIRIVPQVVDEWFDRFEL